MKGTNNTKRNFYDPNDVKAIPILLVCHIMGIETIEKSGKFWCKLRSNERTPSTLLHTEKTPNTFKDFGDGSYGDVITFAMNAGNMSWGDAIQYLGEKFALTPKDQKDNKDLSEFDYEKIGLYGDLVTKNFVFDFDRMSIERISELSEKYKMSMNELRKKHPKIYEQILRNKAVPFIRDLRNEYYLDVLNTHLMLKDMGREDGFKNMRAIKDKFDRTIKDLQNAEQLLIKAAYKTSLRPMPVGKYDPETDVEKILTGEIKPSIGKCGFYDMKGLAKEQGCALKYQSVSIENFNSDIIDDFNYSAFIRGDTGKVVVAFLETDREKLKPLFNTMTGKDNLNNKIEDAEKRSSKRAQSVGENRARSGR